MKRDMGNEAWKDALRSRMDGFERPAPEGLWEAVEAELADRRGAGSDIMPGAGRIVGPAAKPGVVSASSSGKSSRRSLGWLAAALGAAAAVTLLLLLMPNGDAVRDAEGQVAEVAGDPWAEVEAQDAVAEEIDNKDVAWRGSDHGTAVPNRNGGQAGQPYGQGGVAGQGLGIADGQPESGGDAADVAQASQEVRGEVPSTLQDTGKDDGISEYSASDVKESEGGDGADESNLRQGHETVPQQSVATPQEAAPLIADAGEPPRGRKLRGVTVGVASSFASGDLSGGGDAGGLHYASSPQNNVGGNGESYAAVNIPQKTEAVHSYPIKFALTVSLPLARRLSLSTGLSYSRHRSTYDVVNSTYSLYDGSLSSVSGQCRQTLNYVGIPVSLNLLLWDWRRCGAYLTAGGGVEKMVGGKAVTAMSGGEDRDDVDIKPLQWSVMAGAGVQYSLSRRFALYFELGGAYYFDNGATIPNIYGDEPLNCTVTIGGRVNLAR